MVLNFSKEDFFNSKNVSFYYNEMARLAIFELLQDEDYQKHTIRVLIQKRLISLDMNSNDEIEIFLL